MCDGKRTATERKPVEEHASFQGTLVSKPVDVVLTPREAFRTRHGTRFEDAENREPYTRHKRTRGPGGLEMAGSGAVYSAEQLEKRGVRLVIVTEPRAGNGYSCRRRTMLKNRSRYL